jgi:hypothetical protein
MLWMGIFRSRRMARPILAAIAVLALAPGVAMAQQQTAAPADGQVVPTASGAPVAPRHTADGQIASVSDAAAAEDVEDDGPVRDNRVHGEISVGAGTNGYREVSGVATAPIGDVGQATIAIDSEQFNYKR